MMQHSNGYIVAPLVAACATALAYAAWRRLRDSDIEGRSTTSSGGGGSKAYETVKAVDEYLQMHYAKADEIFPYENAPKDAVDFPARCALLVERHCKALQDFTGERTAPTALDIGCAVGGATFELTKCGFGAVLGIDFSQAFINAALQMKADGGMRYTSSVEGDITVRRHAVLPQDAKPSTARFEVGDACDLRADLAPVDAVLAANLICRLPQPCRFLDRLPSLVKPGGVVVLTTPFSWLPGWTPKHHWLGGFVREGVPVRSFDQLKEVMEQNGFVLAATEEMPFVIREHARKYQWGCAHGSVWLKQGA